MNEELRQKILHWQQNELTESEVYLKLARLEKKPANRQVLETIANDELRHYRFWLTYTGVEMKPNRWQVFKAYWVARLLGVTFGIKLMERNEAGAQHDYSTVVTDIAEASNLAREEQEHEEKLIASFDEELLKYTGSVVLGINDALVELTGALAGLTLALPNPKLIALTGSVTGIAAAFSMAASEYLSTKAEAGDGKHPVKAAVYTGLAYIVTVLLLIMPYLILPQFFASIALAKAVALGLTLVTALGIIALFNYYISVANDQPFGKRFTEMAILSLTVAALSFGVGYVLSHFFNIPEL